MDVPLRMIGVASTFFWIFLIGFAVSAAFSVKDLSFDFGGPSTELRADNVIVFSLPIILTNRGFYNIRSFGISTRISDSGGFVVAEGSTVVPVIRRGEEVVAFHNITINVSDVLARNENYLFNDTEFRISEKVDLTVAEVVPVRAVVNHTMAWGAPLYNLAIESPQFEVYNLTHLRAAVPVSFENHALFDLDGAVLVRMYNSSGSLVSVGEAILDVGQHSFYSGVVEFFVFVNPVVEAVPSGYVDVYFQTQFFSYGPVRLSYG